MGKICPNCGTEGPADARFCRKCGQPLEQEAQQAVQPGEPAPQDAAPQEAAPVPQAREPEQNSGSPYPQTRSWSQPGYTHPEHYIGAGGKMKWFQFVVNFQLIFGPIFHFLTAIYYVIVLQGIGVALGAVYIGLGVWMLVIRSRLVKFSSGAHTQYLAYLWVSLVLNVILGSVTHAPNTVVSCLTQLFFAICNHVYFSKRDYLFWG